MLCDVCRRYGHHLPECPYAPVPKIKGYCTQCNDELREDYEYYVDNEDNKFCSEECAVKYHGIKSKEWDNEEE